MRAVNAGRPVVAGIWAGPLMAAVLATGAMAADTGINLEVTGRVLTLVTCNSFAAKTDRFVVTADFVESHSIAR